MNTITNPATTQVLTTPEILEIIFLQTDIRSLLTSAQRVCQTWHHLITTSPSLQKALFFTPIKDSEWGAETKTPNPLLAEIFPSVFPAKDGPLCNLFAFEDLEMIQDAASMARFVRPDESWRRMLVQQPPISELGLFRISSGMGGEFVTKSSIPAKTTDEEKDKHAPPNPHNPNGLLMETLFETLFFAPRLRPAKQPSVRVFWAAEESLSFKSRFQNVTAEFRQMLETFGLVILTRESMPCRPPVRPMTAEQIARERILDAYREYGLDVESRRKGIMDSMRELGHVKGVRLFNDVVFGVLEIGN